MTLPAAAPTQLTVRLRRPHAHQSRFVDSNAKRIVIRAGRRSGKTTGAAIKAIKRFLNGSRILYGAPTAEQIDTFWFEIKAGLKEPISRGYYKKNETERYVELPDTKQRIRAKTVWNADTLRGDYADLLILDEYHLMNEDTWELVGAPMLLDNDGDAVFIYTPPSLATRSISKAKDPMHASKMFKKAVAEGPPRWAHYHFTSRDNPYVSVEALNEIFRDMTALAVRQELNAEEVDEVPGALWSRTLLEITRVRHESDSIARRTIGVDPPGGRTECGIIAASLGMDGHVYVTHDYSTAGSPEIWASRVLDLWEDIGADVILGEANFGGDMVQSVLEQAAKSRGLEIRYEDAHASRGKAVRAEPSVAKFERAEAHMVGSHPALEDELVGWVPGSGKSPNRMDAMVWAVAGLGTEYLPETLMDLSGSISDDRLVSERDWRAV